MLTAFHASTSLFAVAVAAASSAASALRKRRHRNRLTAAEIESLQADRCRRKLSYEKFGPVVGLPWRTLYRAMEERGHTHFASTMFVIRQYLKGRADGDGN